MTKLEFIEELRGALAGEVRQEVVYENVNYYSSYIDEQVRTKGISEEEAVAALGRGTMVAKSIIEAEKSGVRKAQEYVEAQEREERHQQTKKKGKRVLHIALAIIAAIAVLALLIVILIFAVKLIWMFLPVILIVVAGIVIYNLVKRAKNK